MKLGSRTFFAIISAFLYLFAQPCNAEEAMIVQEKTVKILYTNWRGEKAWRTIVPESIYFGSTEWHPEKQWLLRAIDLEKNASRDFAIKDIASWQAEAN